MKEFKPLEKGIIKAFGKEYKANIDDATISKIVLIDIPKLTKIQADIEETNKNFMDNLIDADTYSNLLDDLLQQVELRCSSIIRKILGQKALDEVLDTIGNPCTSDYTMLVEVIADEITDIRLDRNKKLLEVIEEYGED